MATHHASPGEVVDLDSWARDLLEERSKTIAKADEFELVRLVIKAGKEWSTHTVSGPIVIHCIQGKVEFIAMGETKLLSAGQLIYLLAGVPHSLSAVTDSIIVLTIIFKH